MPTAPDRLELLLDPAQTRVTGIDFVEVDVTQRRLGVFFLKDPASVAPSLVNDIAADQIRIYSPSGGDRLASVPVATVNWPPVPPGGRRWLRITVTEPGDFSRYRLYLDDSRIDRYFNDYEFSFKVHCETDVDCKPQCDCCPPDAVTPIAVNYLARDFWSMRGALLDFASQRFPEWPERLEADAGVMLAEVMSALGDELSYYQDRVGREAHLETASQRRSVRRHGRLVDYELHDGLCAAAWLEITAAAGALSVEAGTVVEAIDDAGRATPFLIGSTLDDQLALTPLPIDANRNAIPAHVWDEDDITLPCGARELFLAGNVANLLPLDDTPPDRAPGRWAILRATPLTAGIPEQRLLVRLVEVSDRELDGTPMRDQVQDVPITRVAWEPEQALPFTMELTTLTLRGNILPALAGTLSMAEFTIGAVAGSTAPIAVERQGPDHPAVGGTAPAGRSVTYLFTIPDESLQGLCRRGEDPREALPELRLDEVAGAVLRPWAWRRSFLGEPGSLAGAPASFPTETHFTLDDGSWIPVAHFDRGGSTIIQSDYKTGTGTTIRFGDGVFGRMPAPGTSFWARYRVGNGPAYNVAADALTHCSHANVVAVTNPFPSSGGVAPETPSELRQQAPDAFRAVTYRAVRPEDYAEAAERLPWVQRAGGVFRWTGSWLSAFVTPDPLDAFSLSTPHRRELETWLDRFRQAGRETRVSDPVYADLDIEATVCVDASAYRDEVRRGIFYALFGAPCPSPNDPTPFFSPDNFTFGEPLYRSALEAAIQRVPGVCAVERMMLRRRGWTPWAEWTSLTYSVASHEIVRVENDPRYPNRGSFRVVLTGGAGA